MKKLMTLLALAGVLTLVALPGYATAQDGPALSADPPTVASEGEHTFTVSGTGFSAGLALFVISCTIPGDPLSPASTPAEIAAAAEAMDSAVDCDLANLTPATVDADGTFSAQVTGDVWVNFAWAAGDAARTESAIVPVFVVDASAMDDMGDDMVPEGGAGTGLGGTAGSDSGSVAVPLAATLAALILLSGAALVVRRNN